MKLLILLILTNSVAWAKPLVLISYFDAFNRASFNNSERVAASLAARMNAETSNVRISLCPLNTIFDKAYAQTEECLKALPERPVMVLALGESTCQLKVETIMRNNDKTQGPDNEGNHRSNSPIIPGAPMVLGLRYPLPQMYCALSSSERKSIDLSNSAGSFVCNNTAYQMSYHYPDLQYGFIHVPANNCDDLARKTENSVAMLEKMITKGVTYLLDNKEDLGLPHSSNDVRLSIKKNELRSLRRQYLHHDCLHEYLKEAKGADERRIFTNKGLMN